MSENECTKISSEATVPGLEYQLIAEDDQDRLDRQSSPKLEKIATTRLSRGVSASSPRNNRISFLEQEDKSSLERSSFEGQILDKGSETPSDEDADDLTVPRPLSPGWVGISVAGLILAVVGLVTALITEVDLLLFGMSEGTEKWQMFRWGFAASCIFVSVPLTHGFGGRSIDSRYSFFQPFVGGSQFVLLQIVGWTFYGFALIFFASLFYFASMRLPVVNGLLTSAGIGGIVSQACVLLSLRYFDGRRKWYSTAQKGFFVFRTPSKIDTISFWVVSFLYQIPLIIAIATTMIVMWSGIPGIIFLLTFGYLYSGTYKGNPHQTGARVGILRYNKAFWEYCQHYFSFKLVGPSKGPLDSSKTYLFGFHPHGIYPLTTVWATRGPRWIEHVGNVVPEILGASVMFFIPILRDFVMSAGCRDVSRKSIELSFAEGKSVMLIPGGQREMRETRPESKETVLVNKHKGFVRMALIHGAAMVPVYSFGENQVLDNFRQKSMQEWFQKRILYGFPHLPYGRWYSPIPNPVPITVVVGNPIIVPKLSDPTDEEVAHWHKIYYQELASLFDNSKKNIRHFEDAQLRYSDS